MLFDGKFDSGHILYMTRVVVRWRQHTVNLASFCVPCISWILRPWRIREN